MELERVIKEQANKMWVERASWKGEEEGLVGCGMLMLLKQQGWSILA